MIEALEPIALGELNLSISEFGHLTVKELDALFDGYMRRYERLEDLFIINCALPVYKVNLGRKAPSYKKLTAHRVKNQRRTGDIDEDTQNYWRDILKGGIKRAEKHGN